MATIIPQASSKNPGADLWVLAEPHQNRTVTSLDRSINFQILRSMRHRRSKKSQILSDILSETDQKEVVIPEVQSLLIPSNLHLPNRWVLVLPFTEMNQWAAELHKSWKGLGEPSLRVFLPVGQNAGDFQKIWQNYSNYDDYTLVPE